MQSHKPISVIISGGGTGGHIFPALAIADALKKMDERTEILFVGAKGKMEMERVPAAGYPIKGLWISGLVRSLSLRNVLFPLKVLLSLIRANGIIRRFQPDVVIGVGGYSSGPVLYMATRRGVPTLIQEQNSYAGITNKILGRKVDRVCVAYEGMERFFPKEKIVITGNPVRRDIARLEISREAALNHFGLNKNKKTVLAVGGSQGARTINHALLNNLEAFEKTGIQLIWQTGKSFYGQAREAAAGSGLIKAHDFITRMDHAYAAADIVISRAGAIAVSELCLVGKPVILIPFPYAAEDHQARNAHALMDKSAALMVSDKEASEKLIPMMLDLIGNEQQQKNLSENIRKMAKPDATVKIVKEVMDLIDDEAG